jgi:CheY-like chemotaxis protein
MRRVLVIDDHEPSRRHLVRTLTEAKYEIAGEGVSGKSALTLARSAAPDVIVMAVGLPDMDGKGGGIMSAREKSMTGKILDNIIFLSEVFGEQADRDIPKLPVLEMAKCFDLEAPKIHRASRPRSRAWHYGNERH